MPEAAEYLGRALARIIEPLTTLRTRLLARLEDEAEDMDAATRNRIEATCRSLGRRAIDPLGAWRAMLRAIADTAARAWHAAGPHPVPAPGPARRHATAMSGCTATGSIPRCRSR